MTTLRKAPLEMVKGENLAEEAAAGNQRHLRFHKKTPAATGRKGMEEQRSEKGEMVRPQSSHNLKISNNTRSKRDILQAVSSYIYGKTGA